MGERGRGREGRRVGLTSGIVSATMIYDVHSYLFQSFLSHHGGQKIPELKCVVQRTHDERHEALRDSDGRS